MSGANPMIKRSSLYSVEYAVVFFNSTSQTELRSESRVKIIELGDEWLSLQVPKTSCELGHKLILHLMPKNDVKKLARGQLRNQIPFALSIMANVQEYNVISDDLSLIRVEFTQFSRTEWKEFTDRWKTIQANVDKQFKEMKE